jgi:hypothetical protein
MTRYLYLVALSLALFTISGCQKQSTAPRQKPSNPTFEPNLDADLPPTVIFDLKPSKAGGGSNVYDCRYVARGKTARFRLEFREAGGTSKDIPAAWGEGKFVSVADSNNASLLGDLKKALDAKHIPTHSERVAELPFDTAVLGKKQSRSSSGGFSSTPPGDWVLIKVFLPKGGDDGEVFLNLNPVLGKGEFSIKDSDYGDYLLNAFAKVL